MHLWRSYSAAYLPGLMYVVDALWHAFSTVHADPEQKKATCHCKGGDSVGSWGLHWVDWASQAFLETDTD
jgi:hypothetical protein